MNDDRPILTDQDISEITTRFVAKIGPALDAVLVAQATRYHTAVLELAVEASSRVEALAHRLATVEASLATRGPRRRPKTRPPRSTFRDAIVKKGKV